MRKSVLLLAFALFAQALGAAPEPGPSAGDVEAALEHLRQGREEEGRRLLRDTLGRIEAQLRLNPADAELHFLKGSIHFHSEEDALALLSFSRAAELRPEVARYHFWEGLALLYSQKTGQAEVAFGRAHDRDPKDPRYFYHLCDAKVRGGKEQEAIGCYERFLGAFPRNTRAMFQLAVLIGGANQKAALKLYRAILALDPKYVNAHFNLGQLLQNSDQPKAALEHFSAYNRLEPDDPRVLAKLVQLHTALENHAQAAVHRKRLLELHQAGKIKEPRFCREQLRIRGRLVLAFEYFALPDPLAVKYEFTVLSTKGEPLYSISLGSYKATNDIAREQGRIRPGERLWHLDFYLGRSHQTVAFYKGLPEYEVVRAQAVERIEKQER